EKLSLSLEEYLNESERIKPKFSCFDSQCHGEKSSEVYCGICEKSICKECLPLHNKFINERNPHMLFPTPGLKLNVLCESCSYGGLIEYFCAECDLYLCSKCKASHKCSEENIKDLNDKEIKYKIERNLRNIEVIQNQMEEEEKEYEESLELMKEAMERCQKDLDYKKKQNNKLLRYFKSLQNAYFQTKKEFNFNYNSLNNLIFQDFQDLFQQIENNFFENLNSEFEDIGILNVSINKIKPTERKINFAQNCMKTLIRKVKDEEKENVHLLATDKGNILLTKDRHILVYKLNESSKEFEYMTSMMGHKKTITSLSYNKKENTLLSVSKDNRIKEWNLNTYQCITNFILKGNTGITKALFTDTGKIFSFGDYLENKEINSYSPQNNLRVFDSLNKNEIISKEYKGQCLDLFKMSKDRVALKVINEEVKDPEVKEEFKKIIKKQTQFSFSEMTDEFYFYNNKHIDIFDSTSYEKMLSFAHPYCHFSYCLSNMFIFINQSEGLLTKINMENYEDRSTDHIYCGKIKKITDYKNKMLITIDGHGVLRFINV
ncbi:MAG: hypothetical protein MJ252_29965, partial [archaeon]|nr:hypothetical protein [archaeon]